MRIGLLLPHGNDSKEGSRLRLLFKALDEAGHSTELISYSDERRGEIEEQVKQLDVLLVWYNPIQNGRDRSLLNKLLEEVSDTVFVSTHPRVIARLGTKQVLYYTREMSWGGDIHLYRNRKEIWEQLPKNLRKGPRVLKQIRGNGGLGVWRVELLSTDDDPMVRTIHAARDSLEERIRLSEFVHKLPFAHVIDQPYIDPEPEGMTRVYMTRDRVIGFGHQHVTALVWPPEPDKPIYPEPRVYFPKTEQRFTELRRQMEEVWIPELMNLLVIRREELPVLWDADFLVNKGYKLCEINVSSVYPYPESGNHDIVETIGEIEQELSSVPKS